MIRKSGQITNYDNRFRITHQKIILIFAILGILIAFIAVSLGNSIGINLKISSLLEGNTFFLVLLLFSGFILSVGIVLNPKISVLGILIIVAVIPPVPETIGLKEIIFSVLCLLIFISWIGRVAFSGEDLLFKSPLLKSLLFFIFICFFSYFKAALNNVPFSSWIRGIAPFSMLLLSFIIAREFKNSKDIIILLSTFIVSSLLFSFQTWSPILLKLPFFIFSENSIIAIRSNLTPFAWQAAPLAAFAIIIGSLRYIPSNKLKILLILTAIFFILTILITFTRSMISALFIVLLAAFFLAGKRKKYHKIFLVLSTLVFLLIFLINYTPLSPLFSGLYKIFAFVTVKGASPVSVRIIDFEVALKNFLSQPILGWGLGAKFEYYRTWYRPAVEAAYTHNILTYLLLYLGLMGFSSFAYLIFILSKDLFAQRKGNSLFNKALADSFILSIIGILFYAQFQSIYKSFSFNLFLALVIGVSARITAYRKSTPGSTMNRC